MNMTTSQNKRWLRAKNIVADAIDLPKESRAAFIEKSVANDEDHEALRLEVMSLLAEDTGSGSDVNFKLRAPFPDQIEDTKRDGELLGAWRLKHEIGRGGMGVVYLAERADGAYQQQVAIKLLRLAGATPNEVQRMTRERQSLAQLDHPNIAHLLDGGQTEDGSPYLVMEYIQGQRIDAHCNSHQLTLRARVLLARGVCEAVQSAHQRLLIHRDIKPANVLVTAAGQPKLLDFGIARLLESDASLSGQATHETIAIAFSPRYASPEQMRGAAATVATDVYGLGLLLYELLAGDTPYQRIASFASASAAEVIEAVLQDSVRKASDVARSVASPHAAQLVGELDTILAKACAKLPAERYQTVAQLDDDLARWLDNKPILARPQSWWYSCKKLIARNRLVTAASAIAVIATVAGVISTTIERNVAEKRYAQVRKIANSFIFKHHAAIHTLPGAQPIIKNMVGDGIAYLDELSEDAKKDPQLALELANGYRKLAQTLYNGRSLQNIGDKAGANVALAKVRVLLEQALREIPNDNEANQQLALLESEEASLLQEERKYDESFARFKLAIARFEGILVRDPTHYQAGFKLAQTHLAVAHLHSDQGKPAAEFIAQGGQATERWAAQQKDDDNIESMRLAVLRRQFSDAQTAKNFALAVSIADSEIARYDALLANKNKNFTYHLHLQVALLNRGAAQNSLGRYDDAIKSLQRGIEFADVMLASEPDSLTTILRLARTYFHLGKTHSLCNDPASAQRTFAQSLLTYARIGKRDVGLRDRIQRAEAFLWMGNTSHANRDRAALRATINELNSFASLHPEVFAKAPPADWLTTVRALALKN